VNWLVWNMLLAVLAIAFTAGVPLYVLFKHEEDTELATAPVVVMPQRLDRAA
jgi:hypothetical protein